jgi:hypothetical protein
MKFTTPCFLNVGKNNTIKCPNLTRQCKIPIKLVITETNSNDDEIPVTNILCRVSSGGADIGNFNEPSFRLSNEIDLSPFKGVIDKYGCVSVSLTNRSTEPKKIKLHIEYIESYGSIILEEKIDHFENVLNEVRSKGYCTRLVLTCSRRIESLEFASSATCVDEHEKWIQPLNVPIDNDLDLDDQIYNIDFATEELGQIYSENLEFLELRVRPTKVETNDTFYLYVTAYGFPNYH